MASFKSWICFLVSLLASFSQASKIEANLVKLGLALPPLSLPKGNYASYVKRGNMIYLSGHLPQPSVGSLILGRLGENMNIEEGQHAAKLAGLQLISTLKEACGGDLDRIRKIIKITGFVNSASSFTSQPAVINGCSDLLGQVFGTDIGKHARSAVGVNVLPLGVPVEIEAIVEVDK